MPVDADDDQQLRLDDFQINDLIAVLDDAGDTEWHLARVTDIVDGHLEVHYFGTSGRALSSAKFRPVYIDDGDQRPLLRANGLRHNERASPWTGRIPITADLIIVLRACEKTRFSSWALHELAWVENAILFIEQNKQ